MIDQTLFHAEKQIAELKITIRDLRRALIQMQTHLRYCPWCYGLKRGYTIDHIEGCRLAILLKKAQEAQ